MYKLLHPKIDETNQTKNISAKKKLNNQFLNTVNWIQKVKKNDDDEIKYYKAWKLNPYFFGKIPSCIYNIQSLRSKPKSTVLPEVFYVVIHSEDGFARYNIKPWEFRSWMLNFDKKKKPPSWEDFCDEKKYTVEAELFYHYTSIRLRQLGLYGPMSDFHEDLEVSYSALYAEHIYYELTDNYSGEGKTNAYNKSYCFESHNRAMFDSIGKAGVPLTQKKMTSFGKTPAAQVIHLLTKHSGFSLMAWLSNEF